MSGNKPILPYNRQKALAYAQKWALGRNPEFYDYSNIGGDCTNFASQVLLAGGSIMNFDPISGWYYLNPNQKSPSWTGVDFLYSFLTSGHLRGPAGQEVSPSAAEIGDLVQLSFESATHFNHTLIITRLTASSGLERIYFSSHTFDRLNAQLVRTFTWKKIRIIHILGSYL